MRLTEKIFHSICVRHPPKTSYDQDFKVGLNSAKEFLDVRLKGKTNFKGKTILDIGCGLGSVCIYLAQNGAKKVVGVDINRTRILFAKSKLSSDHPDLSNIVEFKYLEDLDDEKFDIVLSKDSFEHYSDPEKFIFTMKNNLKTDGVMVVGFSPLWKSPYGGHIKSMTSVPWAHLLFPEDVILAEWKRFRPDEEARSFEQAGINKMTLGRYLNIIRQANLKILHLDTNASSNRLIIVCNIFKILPHCREYFTVGIYSILTEKQS